MRPRGGTSSYAHEIARKAWEDMRKAKRRNVEDNPDSKSDYRASVRQTPAEAANALRLRMEERKRTKDSMMVNDGNSQSFELSNQDKSYQSSSIEKTRTMRSSFCQTGTETDLTLHRQKDSSFKSPVPTDAHKYFSHSLESYNVPSEANLRNQRSGNGNGGELSRKSDERIEINSSAGISRNDRVRILADLTEGLASSSNGVVERAAPQLCKRCSPRQIEAQIYGVKQSPSTKSISPSPRPDHLSFSTTRPENGDVLLELRLSIHFDAIKELFAFKKEVSESIALAAGIHPSKITIEEVNPGRLGTVVVGIVVLGESIDSQSRSAQKIAANLRFQSLDEGSLLLRGKHTNQTICLAIVGTRPKKEQSVTLDYEGSIRTTRNELSQQVINLLIQVEVGGIWSKGPQEEAVAALRDLIHDKDIAERISKDHWALSIISKPLFKGSDRAQTHCCACFRHLALEDDCCAYASNAGSKIITGLAVILGNGSENARQKAAAALGNFAWKSEDCRKTICSTEGAIEGLIALLRSKDGRSVESALAALSTLTLSQDCSVCVGSSEQALHILMQELAGAEGLGAGTTKAEIRAAGIIRNLSIDPANRRILREFPGLLKNLIKLARESQSPEARERIEAALQNLLDYRDNIPQSRQSTPAMFDPVVEDASIELLHDLLQLHGWNYIRDVFGSYEGSSSDLSSADVSAYSNSAKGSFLNKCLVLTVESGAMIVSLKRNGQIVARQDGISAEAEGIVFTSLPPSPEPDEEMGSDAANHRLTSQDTERIGKQKVHDEDASIASLTGASLPGQQSKVASNPDLWKRMATEGTFDNSCKDAFHFRGMLLSWPERDADGNVIVRNKTTGEIFYKGAGRQEVYPPVEVHANSLHAELISWASQNGWHDIQRRLLDAGKTDYSKYAVYEKEMQPLINGPQANLFTWRGKTLRLVGESRMAPRRLIDESSKEHLWDFEASTVFKHPWARQAFMVTRIHDKIRILDRRSGTLVAELTLAAPFAFGEPGSNTAQSTQSNKIAAAAGHVAPLEIPPLTSVAGKLKSATSEKQPSTAPFGDQPVSATTVSLGESVRLLKDWTSRRGWYELQRRLFDVGDTDFRSYAEIEPKMQQVHGSNDLYMWGARTLRLIGQRKKPIQLIDTSTNQVLWDFESRTRFHFPWARENFSLLAVKSPNEATTRFQILSKKSREVIAEYAGGRSGSDSLLLQAILMESVSVLEKRGLSAFQSSLSLESDSQAKQLFQAIKDYDPNNAGLSPRSSSGQLRVFSGDVLVISRFGNQGWVFGKIISNNSGKPLDTEGWLPSSYILAVSELAVWRNRLLRIVYGKEGSITISDAHTNESLYNGGQISPSVDWKSPFENTSLILPGGNIVPANQLGASDGNRAAMGQGSVDDSESSLNAVSFITKTSSEEASAPNKRSMEEQRVECAPTKAFTSGEMQAGHPDAAGSASPVDSTKTAAAAAESMNNDGVETEEEVAIDLVKTGAAVAVTHDLKGHSSARVQSESTHNDSTPLSTAATSPVGHGPVSSATNGDHARPQAESPDCAEWMRNVADYEALSESKFLLEGRFRCNAAMGEGFSAEETLELHTSGEFEYVGGSAGADGEKASLVALAGCYKVSAEVGSKEAVLLLLVEVASVGTGDHDVGGNGHEVTGVCVRSLLIRNRGKIRRIEWVSGHEEMGMGICEMPLKAEHVICDE